MRKRPSTEHHLGNLVHELESWFRQRRPTTREGRRRLVELRAILKIRSIRKAERIATQEELDSLAPLLHTAQRQTPEVAE
jgi:hypothetical protein